MSQKSATAEPAEFKVRKAEIVNAIRAEGRPGTAWIVQVALIVQANSFGEAGAGVEKLLPRLFKVEE